MEQPPMSQMVYRTGNFESAGALTRQMLVLLCALMFCPLMLMIVISLKYGRASMVLGIGCLMLVVLLILGIAWLYGHAFRALTYTVTDRGLHIRYLGSSLIPWSEIQSMEKVQPFHLDLVRIYGLHFNDFCQGMFSSRLGRAQIWWVGEKEAVFLRTTKRNYLMAPENIEEFMHTVESRIGR